MILYDNPITRKRVVAEIDRGSLYEITFKDGAKDIVRILSCDLYVELLSVFDFFKIKGYKISSDGFVKMYESGRVKKYNAVREG